MFDIGYSANEIIIHDELCKKAGCGCMGGIRYSKKNNVLLLFINKNSKYENSWNGETVRYMGCGKGNQSANTMGNARIAQSAAADTEVYLIEWQDDMRCKFLGRVELQGKPEYENRRNRFGEEERKVFFNLKLVK